MEHGHHHSQSLTSLSETVKPHPSFSCYYDDGSSLVKVCGELRGYLAAIDDDGLGAIQL